MWVKIVVFWVVAPVVFCLYIDVSEEHFNLSLGMFVITLRAGRIEVLLKSGACHIGIYKGAGVFGLRSSLTRRSIFVGTIPPTPTQHWNLSHRDTSRVNSDLGES